MMAEAPLSYNHHLCRAFTLFRHTIHVLFFQACLTYADILHKTIGSSCRAFDVGSSIHVAMNNRTLHPFATAQLRKFRLYDGVLRAPEAW